MERIQFQRVGAVKSDHVVTLYQDASSLQNNWIDIGCAFEPLILFVRNLQSWTVNLGTTFHGGDRRWYKNSHLAVLGSFWLLAFAQQHLLSSDSLDEQHAEKAKGQNEQAQAQETSKAFTQKEQVICIGRPAECWPFWAFVFCRCWTGHSSDRWK
jgi:hypothetical protein